MPSSANIACPWMEFIAKGNAGSITDRQFVHTDDQASRDDFIKKNKGTVVYRSVACFDDPQTQTHRIAPTYFVVRADDPEETRRKALQTGFIPAENFKVPSDSIEFTYAEQTESEEGKSG